jgi:hypothetical protein
MQIYKSLKWFFNVKTIYVFIAICAIYFIALSIEFKYIYTNDFYKDAYSKSTKPERIEQLISKNQHIEWLNYPFIIVFVLVPAIAVSSLLYMGTALKGYNTSLKLIFSVTLKRNFL